VRTIIALTLASLLVLAGCSTDSASSEPAADPAGDAPVSPPPAPAEDGGYPQEAVDTFLDGCVDQAGEDLCVCALDVLQAEVSYDEFEGMFAEMEASGTLPPDLLTLVVERCV
jgi:hypothetical protein